MGWLFYLAGIAMWKLTHMLEFIFELYFLAYAFLAMAAGLYWRNQKKQKNTFFRVGTIFLGVCLRVIKNVIAEATEIKNENDLTV